MNTGWAVASVGSLEPLHEVVVAGDGRVGVGVVQAGDERVVIGVSEEDHRLSSTAFFCRLARHDHAVLLSGQTHNSSSSSSSLS